MNLSCLLGWGTTEYTGEKSNVLMGTQLDVVDISRCQQVWGNHVSTTNQLCTYRSGTDACQVTHNSIYIHFFLGYYILLRYQGQGYICINYTVSVKHNKLYNANALLQMTLDLRSNVICSNALAVHIM